MFNVYHIGIVESVISKKEKGTISSDDSVQAVVNMWDDNLIILLVDKKLANKIKKGDYVLSDYRPSAPTSLNRKMIINKILPKAQGKRIFEMFNKDFEKRKGIDHGERILPPMQYIR